MEKEKAKLVINEFQESELPKDIINRKIIHVDLNSRSIISVYGPRQSGKTYYFYQLIEELITKEKIKKDRILYVSFEDERLMPFQLSDFEQLLEAYYELYPENKENTVYLFFDEVQNIDHWEIAIRRIYDREKVRIFLTGSSSKLLSKEIASSLRGRTLSYEMLPFSFEEILLVNNIKLDRNFQYTALRFKIKALLKDYMKFGGFPRVVLEKTDITRIRLLQEYLNTLLVRDIFERFSVRNKPLIKELIRYSLSNMTKLLSISNVYKMHKQKQGITKRTAINYIRMLEDVMLLFLIPKFSRSLKEQLRNPSKGYIVDNGLRMAAGFYMSDDLGIMMENTVFIKLREKRTYDPLLEIFYWSNQESEVDFVLRSGPAVTTLIQVTYASSRDEIMLREISGIINASEDIHCNNLLIITWDYENEEKIQDKKIKFIPLWKWLLDVK
jgi:hypothetical protein